MKTNSTGKLLAILAVGQALGGRTMEQRLDGPGVLPWPKGQPYNREQQERHTAERIAAAQAKRERKAAKKNRAKCLAVTLET